MQEGPDVADDDVAGTRHISYIEGCLIQQDCHPRQNGQISNGQGSSRLIESPATFHLCATRLFEIYVNFVLDMITQLAFAQYVNNMFHSL